MLYTCRCRLWPWCCRRARHHPISVRGSLMTPCSRTDWAASTVTSGARRFHPGQGDAAPRLAGRLDCPPQRRPSGSPGHSQRAPGGAVGAKSGRALCRRYLLKRFSRRHRAVTVASGRAVTRHAGLPPGHLEFRCRAARDQLAGDARLANVAANVGFADQSHLTRVFKARFGLPPGPGARSFKAASRSARLRQHLW